MALGFNAVNLLVMTVLGECLPLPLDDEEEDAGGDAEDDGEHGHDGREHDVMQRKLRLPRARQMVCNGPKYCCKVEIDELQVFQSCKCLFPMFGINNRMKCKSYGGALYNAKREKNILLLC